MVRIISYALLGAYLYYNYTYDRTYSYTYDRHIKFLYL